MNTSTSHIHNSNFYVKARKSDNSVSVHGRSGGKHCGTTMIVALDNKNKNMSTSKDVFSFPVNNSKSYNKEVVTPHKISVVILIREQCLLKEQSKYPFGVTTFSFRRKPHSITCLIKNR